MLDNRHARAEAAKQVAKDSDAQRDQLAHDVLGGLSQVRLAIPLDDPTETMFAVQMAADELRMLLLALREEVKRPGCRPVDVLSLVQRRVSVLHKRLNHYGRQNRKRRQ